MLKMWKIPEQIVWLAIFSAIFLLIPQNNFKIIGLNILLILMPIYFFQGIAILSFFFDKKKFPIVLRFFIYSIIAIQQIFLLLIIGLGFFDTWVNFRRIK